VPLISISSRDMPLNPVAMISQLGEIWREQRHEVHVARDFHPSADLCILHHDRTFVSPADIPPAPAGVRVLNVASNDISKRRYSSLLVTPDSDWTGPVILKTNLNHFGAPERRDGKTAGGELRKKLATISWRLARRLPPKDYPVLDGIGAVPDWVWRNEGLIVEKFLPERHEGLYCLRGWIFFGAESYGYRMFATHPLVKVKSIVSHEYLDEPPTEPILRLREEMGFDFGKFDYVVHDGQPILLDANKTPSLVRGARSERVMRLARGVQPFLK
jgi:hypothetical protein